MIKVTIELISGGVGEPEHLGTAAIINDGTGSKIIGNYSVMLSKWGNSNATWKKGKFAGFPRKKLGPWDLLYRALEVTVGDRR